ncbi:MAG: His/Gly/Thr/Pro-type tRNA ligase C-terminal domain-containing protein, partial [Acetomicrobium sp.]
DYSGKSLSSQLKMASNKKAKLACILGSAEIQKGVVTVKDLVSGLQEEVPQNSLTNHIKQYIVR